jgi:hypothetical protein
MLPLTCFERFGQAIASLPLKGKEEKYERPELICPRSLLFRESGLDVYYVPFHYVNRRPKSF